MRVIVKALLISLCIVALVLVATLLYTQLYNTSKPSYYTLDYIPSSLVYKLAGRGYSGLVVVVNATSVLSENISSLKNLLPPDPVLASKTSRVLLAYIGIPSRSRDTINVRCYIVIAIGGKGLFREYINQSMDVLKRHVEREEPVVVDGYRLWIFNVSQGVYPFNTTYIIATNNDESIVVFSRIRDSVFNLSLAKEVIVKLAETLEHSGGWSGNGEIDSLLSKVPAGERRLASTVFFHRDRVYIAYMCADRESTGYKLYIIVPRDVGSGFKDVLEKTFSVRNITSVEEIVSTNNYVLYSVSVEYTIATTTSKT